MVASYRYGEVWKVVTRKMLLVSCFQLGTVCSIRHRKLYAKVAVVHDRDKARMVVRTGSSISSTMAFLKEAREKIQCTVTRVADGTDYERAFCSLPTARIHLRYRWISGQS
jgi:hypothetical protein